MTKRPSRASASANGDRDNRETTSRPVRRIGYVGLGIMGSAMAGNLLAAGYELTVWNRTASKCEPLSARGARVATSPAALAAEGQDVICINVTDTPDVEAVLFGRGGVAEGSHAGLVVCDHSTISPTATIDFAARLARKGAAFLDAPVSGGDVGARKGTLSIMVGGDAETLERCRPMLEVVGGSISHLGGPGSGQACKACNQIAVALSLLGTCEALAMAKRSGLDLAKTIEVLAAGAAGSWQLTNLGPRIAAGDHAPGFMVDLMLKDLAIVAETARETGLPLAGTALAEAYLRTVSSAGGGRLGTQAMVRTLEELGSFELAARDR
jgi:3-hydroxyisobutyrate dehydrogenase